MKTYQNLLNGLIKSNLFENKLDSNAALALKWDLRRKSPYNWRFIQKVGLMSNNQKFIIFYSCLILCLIGLLMAVKAVPAAEVTLDRFWGVYVISQCWALMMAGVGLMLPISLMAFGLGWLQLYLLATGQIEPHLTSEGLGPALRSIFGSFINPN